MNISTQLCGMVILGILLLFYYGQKRVNVYTTHSFARLLWMYFINICLDVGSIVALHFAKSLSVHIVHFICKLYLCSLIEVLILGFFYICSDFYEDYQTMKTTLLWGTISGIGLCVVIFLLPIYSNDPDSPRLYTYGPSVYITYIFSFVIILGILFLGTKYRTTMRKGRWMAVTLWIGIWLLAAAIQFFNRDMLIVGFSGAVGMMVIYLLLENPGANIDRNTGLFNLNAFYAYSRYCKRHNVEMSILCLSAYAYKDKKLTFYKNHDVVDEMVEYVSTINMGTVFLESSQQVFLVFNKEEDMLAAKKEIQKRFEKPWGSAGQMFHIRWIQIPTMRNIRAIEDVLPMIQYAKSKNIENDDVLVDSAFLREMYKNI